jgi:hypothetical protein
MPASNCAAYGLRTPEGELIGAVCFGRGPPICAGQNGGIRR